ncbi:MAG: phosphate acyltransferase PlsX [Sedimentisphaerales bacterium]|nr:phosphate acyltransferase PlsX [Sedimentisphaerales bacterium]HNY79756.1 phosphate acyltransferase PlsX [Sedimentisphaerales bacterium]HOC62266.1 phosphate acyltransferase PlsX [Sedimentisphaerales bacterium]HOH63093.1 phosphate acyltransferase PlsX [Sedimentisphaerales bacterium]HQA91582.1 phosphate acyltransferase PlsX [Sedimentisphaerales bacterium]
MRIAIDAMGGDYAPDEIIAGAVEAVGKLDKDDELILVGPQQVIESKLTAVGSKRGPLSVVDAPDVIGMDDSPVDSLRSKPKSSIAVMAKLAKHGLADAVISAGNTGACVAAFQMRMRTLPGVNRPGIAVVFPMPAGPVTICDVGANIACKPINLYQYGLMSTIYARSILGITKPRVGLMSIGEEDAKGNEVVKRTRELLRSDPRIDFIGNIEGRDIFRGVCDVVVCEGFVGNVILKLTEGAVDGLFRAIKQELMQEKARLALKFKPIIMRVYQKHDYNEYGGAPLLGINGTALICHGSSKSRTIRNAVSAAKNCYTQRINDKIIECLAEAGVRTSDA